MYNQIKINASIGNAIIGKAIKAIIKVVQPKPSSKRRPSMLAEMSSLSLREQTRRPSFIAEERHLSVGSNDAPCLLEMRKSSVAKRAKTMKLTADTHAHPHCDDQPSEAIALVEVCHPSTSFNTNNDCLSNELQASVQQINQPISSTKELK